MVATSSPLPNRLQLRPHYGQQAVLDSKAKFTAAIAGTGGGKTVGGYAWLLLQMIASPGQLWVVAEPTDKMVNRILLTSQPGRMSIVQFLQRFDPAQVFLKTEGILRHKLGTVIFASADKPDTLQGAQLGGIWLDEAGLMSYDAWLTAVQRVGFYGGRILLTTTPYNMGWLYSDVWQRWEDGDKDYFVSSFPSLANPRYPKEEVERAARTMSAARFKMRYEGKFGHPEGMVYDCWDPAVHVVDDFPVPAEWDRIGGLDFGYNHPTAGAMLACDPDGVWYLYDEHYQREATLDVHADVLRAKAPGITWYADPAAAQQILEMRRRGLSVREAINDVWTGIDTVYALLKGGRLKFFRSCKHSRDEVSRYVRKQKDGKFIDEVVKEHDDLMDGLRYGLYSHLKGPRLALHV